MQPSLYLPQNFSHLPKLKLCTYVLNTNCPSPLPSSPRNYHSTFWFSFLFKKDFTYLREKERECERNHEQRGKAETEGEAGCWAGSLMWGWTPGPWDHDLSQGQALNRLSHPGAPTFWFFCLYEFSFLSDFIQRNPSLFVHLWSSNHLTSTIPV